jgi:CRISPR/Cas system CMR subunit Cmr6 (Cas7 group RAMP superfamily)
MSRAAAKKIRAEFYQSERKRKISDISESCRIPVLGARREKYGEYCTCSSEDFEELSKYSWAWNVAGYVVTTTRKDGRKQNFFMSRLIMNPSDEKVVDHINGDKTNNTRENLRIVSRQQNSQNRKKCKSASISYFGVYKNRKRFSVKFTVGGEQIRLGTFNTMEEAAKVYDAYITQNRETLDLCHPLNFPECEHEYLKMEKIILPGPRKNKTGYRGIVAQLKSGKYQANVGNRYIGIFKTAEEAARAHDAAVVASNLDRTLNFPDDYPNYEPEKKIKSPLIEIDLQNPEHQEALKTIGISPDEVDTTRDIFIQIRKKTPTCFTIIERNDYEIVKYSRIYAGVDNYIVHSVYASTHKRISRTIMEIGVNQKVLVDHVNSNIWDNRRRKLALVSYSGNAKNSKKRYASSSQYIGVAKNKQFWGATIVHEGKVVFSKYLKDELYTARARDLFAITNYPGQYRLNFDDWENEGVVAHWQTTLQGITNKSKD